MTDSDKEYLKCKVEVLKSFSPEFGQLGIDLSYFTAYSNTGDINDWIKRFNQSKQENKFQELDELVKRLVECAQKHIAKQQPKTLLLRAIILNNVDLFKLFYEEGNSNDPPQKSPNLIISTNQLYIMVQQILSNIY